MDGKKMIRLLICIDDTDELHGVGTGKLAQMLAEAIREKGWGNCQPISRHQLYVHQDIPYTSHNSAMCFASTIEEGYLQELIDFSSSFLCEKSAKVADPGLCVVNLEELNEPAKLITFGQMAKKNVLCKEDAYKLAQQLQIHLSEHGGTGQGVIGALAGAGLRMSGNDGRFKGRHEIPVVDGRAAVQDILKHSTIDEVRTVDGDILGAEEKVRLEGKVKSVLLDGKSVLLVKRNEHDEDKDTPWVNLSREQMHAF